MKVLDVERREPGVADRSVAKQPPRNATIIRPPAIIKADGEVAAAVLNIGSMRRLGKVLSGGQNWRDTSERNSSSARLGNSTIVKHNWQGGLAGSQEARLAGFQPMFMAWGFSPPVPLRRRYGCSQCAMDRESPDLAASIRDVYRKAWGRVTDAVPEAAADHQERVTSVILEDWLVGGLPFTSGVVNHTAALPYHRDSGNLRRSWSLQVCLRSGVEGGLLHLPGLGVWFACDDGDVLFFEGQKELHGVTPVRRRARDAYRFTMVAYAKSQMQKCWPVAEEHARAARAATEANRRKVQR